MALLPSFRKLTKCYDTMRFARVMIPRFMSDKRKSDPEDENQLTTKENVKEIFQKEFPELYKDGQYVSRIAYVDFIDQTLARMKELGIEKNIEAYKELLRVFPPEKYHPTHRYEAFGLQHAPQQLAAVRILVQMEMNKIRPDKEVERLVITAFSKASNVWLKIARMNYWSMKGRNIDPHPLPEVLPEEPHQLAKLAMMRMLDDPKSIVTVANTSRAPDSIDKTWLVFSQSPAQRSIIDKLDPKCTLRIEQTGLTYVDTTFLSYYTLRYYEDEETRSRKAKEPEPDYNFNTVEMKFYGKPIREKLQESEEAHYIDGSYVLAIGITGTSSQDSILSWLKILQERNPNLKRLNVVFDFARPTHELITENNDQQEQYDQQRRQKDDIHN